MFKRLHYPGVAVQVAMQNAPDVEIALGQALRGWHAREIPDADPEARQSFVQGKQDGYTAVSCYLDEALEGLGVAGATCAIIADLAQDYFQTRPGALALHCAAFTYNQRLIAVTGPSRAGKSTLAARLTMEADMQVFCDDVLPLLEGDSAIALGIAPRLRLPLPDSCSEPFKTHVARHMGPRDDSYGYLCAPTVASHGTLAPLSVLLILDRRSDTVARFHDVAEDEALHFLLSQNMSDLRTAEIAFDKMSDLLAGVACLRLVYSDLENAVALIRTTFGSTAPLCPETQIFPALPSAPFASRDEPRLSTDIIWSRNSDVMIQRKGSSAFLWRPGGQLIWHLNTLGFAVWTLLEIPGSARDIAMVLAEQFPLQDESSLMSDVNKLLNALAEGQLIVADEVE
jgi:hypothetical protein